MLIINILLIILFFIILFYDLNLVEGQFSDDDGLEDIEMYNYSNLSTDLNTIISEISISKYLGFDLKKVMKNYTSLCEDNVKLIDDDDIIESYNKEHKKKKNNNGSMNMVNIENNLNNILGKFNIQIENGHESTVKKDINNSNKFIPTVCSLVDTIYDENNNLSDSLVKSITDEYGNCFTHEEGGKNKFNELCEQSCHLQEDKLEVCNETSIDNLKNCEDYLKIKNHHREFIHIKKDNGLYYNCVPNTTQPDYHYEEKACIPKNNMCKSKFINPVEGAVCNTFDTTNMVGKCEDHYMFDSGHYYNCQKDNTNHKDGAHACTKNLKIHYNKPCIDTSKIDIMDYEYCNFQYT